MQLSGSPLAGKSLRPLSKRQGCVVLATGHRSSRSGLVRPLLPALHASAGEPEGWELNHELACLSQAAQARALGSRLSGTCSEQSHMCQGLVMQGDLSL